MLEWSEGITLQFCTKQDMLHKLVGSLNVNEISLPMYNIEVLGGGGTSINFRKVRAVKDLNIEASEK